MGVIGNLLRAKNEILQYTIGDWSRDLKEVWAGRLTNSGVKVSEATALRFVTVFSCVRVLVETMGSLPLQVYKERPGGGSDKVPDHPLFGLLRDQPNDEMNSQTWIESQMGHLALSGNTYSVITQNRRGQVIDLYPVPWHQVVPLRNISTWKIEYWVNDRGKQEKLPAEKVFHVPGWGFDGIQGYSPIRMGSQAVGIGMAAAEFTERFYGQGMNVGTVLEYPNPLSDTAYERVKKWLEEEAVGLGKSHKPFIVEDGGKLNRIAMPLSDAQFIETRKFSREEICGLFRVPPHMIADLTRSTNNNIEHQSLEFVKFTMLPYITRFEKAMRWKLLSQQERDAGYYVRFNVEELLRADYKSRQEGLQLQRQNGVVNADEWRQTEERNPIGGVAGEAYLVNGNMISTETAAKQLPKQTGSGQGGGTNG